MYNSEASVVNYWPT